MSTSNHINLLFLFFPYALRSRRIKRVSYLAYCGFIYMSKQLWRIVPQAAVTRAYYLNNGITAMYVSSKKILLIEFYAPYMSVLTPATIRPVNGQNTKGQKPRCSGIPRVSIHVFVSQALQCSVPGIMTFFMLTFLNQ